MDGCVVWFTGLSGSGKTTTASELLGLLRGAGVRAELLDGDELRKTICKDLGFSREGRLENIRRVAFVAELLARNGVVALVSAITPYREMREHARSAIGRRYIEVYVECPLEECERRDAKGLYAKARKNEIERFTGISDPYDVPESPDVVIRTQDFSAADNARTVLDFLRARGWLPAHVEGCV